MSTLFDEVASPEVPGEDESGAVTGGADRKRLLVLGGAGAVALVALGYFVVLPALSGGSGSSTPAPVITHHVAAGTTKQLPVKAKAQTKPSATPSSVPTIAVQNALQVGRDPFAPLVVDPAAGSAPAATSSPGTGGTSTSGTSSTGTTGTAGGNTSSTTSATPTPSVSTVSSTGTLVLKRIYQQDSLWHVDVTWNGQPFSSVLGGDFAGIFSFDSQNNGTSASFTYGGGQHFTLVINGTKTF